MPSKKAKITVALDLILLATVVGISAFVASAASAAPADWLIKEGGVQKTFSEHGITEETAEGTLEEGQLPKGVVIATGLTIGCEKLHVKIILLSQLALFLYLLLTKPTAHIELFYLNCVSLSTSTGKELTACNPIHGVGDPNGTISAKALGLIVLHEGSTYILVTGEPTTQHSPEAIPPFAEVVFPSGECAIEGTVAITGSTIFKVGAAGKGGVDEVKLLLNPISEKETKALFPTDQLKFGARNIYLASSAMTVQLTGALKGKEWGAKAE